MTEYEKCGELVLEALRAHPLTEEQRAALLALPVGEETVIDNVVIRRVDKDWYVAVGRTWAW